MIRAPYHKYEDWILDNPLRVWRFNDCPGEEVMSTNQLASRLGVGQPTVLGWEEGRFSPRGENAMSLNRLTGIDMAERLRDWRQRRPKP